MITEKVLAGYYNHNVRVDTPAGPYLERTPISGADVMDLRLWPEASLLAALDGRLRDVPRLWHASVDPPFQIHEFIEGYVVNDRHPRGVAVPPHVVDDVVGLFGALARFPRSAVPALPAEWPDGCATAAFAQRLTAFVQDVYERCRPDFADLYATFGVPDDPLAPVRSGVAELSARQLTLVHADVHRKNMIVDAGRTVFIDWELALWGDPVYDLAVHLHKMDYLPAERERLLAGWCRALSRDMTTDWADDVERYAAVERIKSVLVDTVRYAKQCANAATSAALRAELIAKLTAKLNNAYRYWDPRRSITAERVDAVLREWALAHPSRWN